MFAAVQAFMQTSQPSEIQNQFWISTGIVKIVESRECTAENPFHLASPEHPKGLTSRLLHVAFLLEWLHVLFCCCILG
jgi:hypothetical protein